MAYAGLYPLPAICFCPSPCFPGALFANETRTAFQVWAPTGDALTWLCLCTLAESSKPWHPA